jgi:hypothetical protein
MAPGFGALRRTHLYTLKHDCQAVKADSEKSLIPGMYVRQQARPRLKCRPAGDTTVGCTRDQ